MLLCTRPRVSHRIALSDDARLTSDFSLSVAYTGPKSRTERPRKIKIGTDLGHATRDSDTIFKVKRSKVNLQGAGHIVAVSRTACLHIIPFYNPIQFMYLCIYVFIYLFIYLLTYSLTHSLTHSFIHLFIYLFIYSFVRSFVRSFVHSFIHSFIHSFVFLFIYLSIYLFVYLVKLRSQFY